MKDVLLQMRLADDQELLITEDEDDKKHGKHAKKEQKKGSPISLADAMSYTQAMTDQSNGVHGFETERKPMSGAIKKS